MKIFVSRQIPGDHLEKLKKEGWQVEISDLERPLKAEELLEKAKGVDALLSLLTDRVDGDFMDAVGPQLKVVSNYAVGFDNINIEDATNRGIVATNTPCNEVNEAVAEHTWALILALTRRIVEADEATRRGSYKGWEPDVFLGTSLVDKTLGIVGLGRIGSMVAERAKGSRMKVLYYERKPEPEKEKEFNVKYVEFDELLKKSDIVTLHLPLTHETRNLISKETLEKMKKGSYLINTARGPIVDEDALVRALRDGKIRGAALDVFENEPNIHPELIGMENVILTPHIGSATIEVREKMGQMAVDAILNVLTGKKPENIINEKVWKNRRK